MKKLSLALITGGALCAFGVLLGGAALAMTGFEFSKVVTTMKYENKTAAYEPSRNRDCGRGSQSRGLPLPG